MSVFYSEAILSRRGPLARVWLAAHYERKLSKTQTLQTDISQSVDAIVGPEVVPMALRLSGQLLLGVVRIYSRKAKYLLDDCNEAIVKIKMAFKPGVVDLTEDQLAVSRNAITITGEGFDADFMMADMNWDMDFNMPPAPGQQHVAPKNNITLGAAEDLLFGYGDDFVDFGGDVIGSQDFTGLETGLTFGEEMEQDEAESVEIGRDAPGDISARMSLGSALRGPHDRDLSVFSKGPGSIAGDDFGPTGYFGPGLGLEEINLEDLGVNFPDVDLPDTNVPMDIDREQTPGQVRDRGSSPLSPPPPQTPPDESMESIPTQTPRTAAQLAKIADQQEAAAQKKKPAKKQIVDSVTELRDGLGARSNRQGLGGLRDPDVSAITAEQRFLPQSRTVMRLLEIRADPVAYFMPTKTTAQGTFVYTGPPGLAPELADLFFFPAPDLRRARDASTDPNPRAAKKPRTDQGEQADEPEVALHDEPSETGIVRPPSELMDLDNTIDFSGPGIEDTSMGGAGIDVGLGDGDGFDNMGLGEIDDPVTPKSNKRKPRRSAPGAGADMPIDEPQSPGAAADDVIAVEAYDSQSCSIGMFDPRGSTTGESQAQEEQESAEIERETAQVQSKGYSKNTVKAIAVIRKGLDAEPESDDKFLSFAKVSEKASRRAASAFFFELLVLGTRDCVKLNQSAPFENIEIRSKDKLYESFSTARHLSTQPSMRPPSST